MEKLEAKRCADRALTAIALLGLFVQGERTVRDEDHLDELYDAVIGLLEEARDERWRLRRDTLPDD